MPTLKIAVAILAILMARTVSVIAQFSTVPENVSNSAARSNGDSDFISIAGGFSIDLPSQGYNSNPVKSTEGVNKGGEQYDWRQPSGSFSVAYVDRVTAEGGQQFIEQLAKNLIVRTTESGGSLIEKKNRLFEGRTALEIRFRLSDGMIDLTRYYLIGKRLFMLNAGWKESDNGTAQIKILDSFKVIAVNAALAKKIAGATPPQLPQFPTDKKLTSDASDDQLKGKVKSVVVTDEDLTGNWRAAGIKKFEENYYNTKGRKLKRVFYDSKGFPFSITVYGFIDGNRVANEKFVRNEYNHPMTINKSEIVKPADTRYTTKYDYKYDGRGRIEEINNYRNNGELSRRVTYTYDGNKATESWFEDGGKLVSKTIREFDAKHNLAVETFVGLTADFGDSRYNFAYEAFDKNGNWTKCTVTGQDAKYGGGFTEQHYVQHRAITYYP
jgi:hypothetical protein